MTATWVSVLLFSRAFPLLTFLFTCRLFWYFVYSTTVTCPAPTIILKANAIVGNPSILTTNGWPHETCAYHHNSNCIYIPNRFVVFSCVVSQLATVPPVPVFTKVFTQVCYGLLYYCTRPCLHVSSYCSTHHFTVRLRFMMTFVSGCAGRTQHHVREVRSGWFGRLTPQLVVCIPTIPTVSQYQSALQASFKVLGTVLTLDIVSEKVPVPWVH